MGLGAIWIDARELCVVVVFVGLCVCVCVCVCVHCQVLSVYELTFIWFNFECL